MVPSYWPQLCLELISVHPCGCETQQTFTGCTTTFITLLVLNTTPDCNCTEKPKHTFFQFNSLHSHMTPVSTESFFLLRYLQKMKSTRGAKKKKKKSLLEDAQLQCFSKIRVQTWNGTLLMAPHVARATGVPREKKKMFICPDHRSKIFKLVPEC